MRANAFLRNRTTMIMKMSWAPEFQSIALGEEEFSHQGSISTDPSHDLAHLIVGASEKLPWAPVGNTTTTRMAEYNAILLEHLLTNIYDCVATPSWSENIVLTKTLSDAQWFVEHHYAPFPISAEQALSEFVRRADSEAIIRLAPHFSGKKSGTYRPKISGEGLEYNRRNSSSPGNRRPDRA
jgi:hypothetical protein